MKISNIVFDLTTEIEPQLINVIIPYILLTKKIKNNDLLDYIFNFIKIDKSEVNLKIINDIQKKINKIKKKEINLVIVLQNKTQYFKVVLMILKVNKKELGPKKLKLDQNKGEFIEKFRLLGSTCLKKLKKSHLNKSNIILPNFKKLNLEYKQNDLEGSVQLAFIEGMILTLYTFDKYKKQIKSIKNNANDFNNPNDLNNSNNLNNANDLNNDFMFNFVSSNQIVKKDINQLFNSIKTLFFVKDLINEPANKITPVSFINTIKNFIKVHNLPLTVIVLDKKKLLKLGMRLLVSVGDGSNLPGQSKLMILIYTPKKTSSSKKTKKIDKTEKDEFSHLVKKKKSNKKKPKRIEELHKALGRNNPDYILVGKGVTFDTGGISLKKSKHMSEMKTDKTGASITAGLLFEAAARKTNKTIVGFIPLAENNINSNATIPGDVIRSYDGSTVEILNTDAEGRLMMADCLGYISRHFKNTNAKIIDIATLTGQQESLSGKMFGNVLGRHPEFGNQIVNSGYLTNEKMVYLPYMKEFENKMKSNIADYKNANENNRASLMLSTAFLGLFISPNLQWAHIDIAGPTWDIESKFPYMTSEGSGFGFRMLNNIINS